MDPISAALAIIKNLPWKWIALFAATAAVAAWIWIQQERIDSLEIANTSLTDRKNELETKVSEIATAAASYQRSCKATIAALDKIRDYDAAKLRDLEAAKKRIEKSTDADNGAIAPVLRDALDSLR
jgi:flagellar biosynthesis component FlhA